MQNRQFGVAEEWPGRTSTPTSVTTERLPISPVAVSPGYRRHCVVHLPDFTGVHTGDVGDLLGIAAGDGPFGASAPLLTSMFVAPPAGLEPATRCLEGSRRRFADQGVSEECLVRHPSCCSLSSAFERLSTGDCWRFVGSERAFLDRLTPPVDHCVTGGQRRGARQGSPYPHPPPASEGRPMLRSVRLLVDEHQ